MHQTCTFTRLPITANERCRLVLIASHHLDVDVLTESTSLYKVLTTPFRGEYNDYGFIRPAKNELDRLVEFAKKLGIPAKVIGKDPEEMASNIGQHISYEEVRAIDKDIRVNYCLISERAYSALEPRLSSMREGIDKILLPMAEKQAQMALEGSDDFLKRLLRKKDQKTFYSFCVANALKKFKRRDLHKLAVHGLDTSSPRHFMTELYFRPKDHVDNLHEIGEIQVLSDFLSEIRGFWSPQSGQGHDQINLDSYNILEKLIKEGIDIIKLNKEEAS